MKKIIAAICGAAVLAGTFTGAYFLGKIPPKEAKDAWKTNFNTALPTLRPEDGWYEVLNEEFTATPQFPQGDTMLNPAIWSPSPHGPRREHYWCDQMVEVKDGKAIIHTKKDDSHSCDGCKDKNGNPVTKGVFTGGIETRRIHKDENGKKSDELLFSQAFGYFETKVKLPLGGGMWAAFWLQSPNISQVGNEGRDGSEIDVFESSFLKKNPTYTGSAIHFDGYDRAHKSLGVKSDTGVNLYDGQFHTFGVKWTPREYVFYVDGKATWATNFGGVTDVREYLRLTVELKEGGVGPYGQGLDSFENKEDGSTDFVIDSVKVYQNKAYESFVRDDSVYAPRKD